VMWYAAGQMHHAAHAADYGFDMTVKGHDWSASTSATSATAG
jgi:hypothetical protein